MGRSIFLKTKSLVSFLQMSGILAVHEFHVWQLAGNRVIASAHIRCHNPQEYMTLAGKIKDLFHNEGIHSTTIQPEFAEVRLCWSFFRSCLRYKMCAN